MAAAEYAISVKGLKKSYGELKVLKGVSFKVEKGRILALLGPNGAGKTTTIRILSTLLKADDGEASINGFSVRDNSGKVRSSIGLTGQFAAVDEYLTAEENLYMIGRLYRMSREETEARSKQLLKDFDLVDAAKRPVKTFSGGMKRRIDLAMSLIASPPIIFLDEPTTGLDPRSRNSMWQMIRKLTESGTTILLTTQYMEEADQLADNIVVIDNGKVIAEGTSSQLKAKIGSDRLELTISPKSDFEAAKRAVKGESVKADPETRQLSVAVKNGISNMKKVLQKLEDGNITVDEVSLHRPSLDDVFLSLTGHGTSIKTKKGDK